MPIRIERDRDSGGYIPNPGRSGRSGVGGGGSMMQFIPMLIGMFGRNPKLLLLVAVAAAVWYFAGGKGCNSLMSEGVNGSAMAFSQGAEFDLQRYSATEIYEPLADNKRNPLPQEYSLLEYAPQRLNQGQQGSCVAWASAYAARSIMHARETGNTPERSRFSPSYLYNQIALEDCQGAYLPEAMKVMQRGGLAPFEEMPYTDSDCSSEPSSMAKRSAMDFKIDGYQRLTKNEDPQSVDVLAIKQNLAQGAPVVIGMMVGGTFMQDMMGKKDWRPSDSDYDMRGFGGHAMCVIGYDDYHFGNNQGAFQIMNSWGMEWGDKGVAWVAYRDFETFVKEAYGIYPAGNAHAPTTTELQFEFGIVLNETDANVSLVNGSTANTFSTARKLKKGEQGGDRFKIQFTNNLECYVYIFGQETDGSTYVLFPYTEKHSPFCGITGTRLFPRTDSYYPDDKGSKDYFAIVVSKTVLDYDAFNKKLSTARGSSLAEKLENAMGDSRLNASWHAGETLKATVPWGGDANAMTGAVIEVNK